MSAGGDQKHMKTKMAEGSTVDSDQLGGCKQRGKIYLCGTYKNMVRENDAALLCNLCEQWHHIICEDINEELYKFLTWNEVGSLH